MNNDILKLANECRALTGIRHLTDCTGEMIIFDPANLEAFYRAAFNAGIEAAAKVCDEKNVSYVKDGERWLKGTDGKPDSRIKDLAPNLEAAYEMEMLMKHGSVVHRITEADKCAAAIRALEIKP